MNLKAANHQVILTSETYPTKSAAEGGIEAVKKTVADDARYPRKVAKDSSPYFVLTAGNGQTIGRSEMYTSARAMEGRIASVKTNAPTADVKELT